MTGSLLHAVSPKRGQVHSEAKTGLSFCAVLQKGAIYEKLNCGEAFLKGARFRIFAPAKAGGSGYQSGHGTFCR